MEHLTFRVITGDLAAESDAFTVVSLAGQEAISELFSFDVVVLAAPSVLRHTETLEGFEHHLLMHDVAFRLGPLGNLRIGMINEVRVEGPIHHEDQIFTRLRLNVVPRAWLLTQRRNTRIFQHKYIDEIVSTVLTENGVRHRWDLQLTYPKRIYCTQYEETDYAFIRRLFAEEGIYFYFEFDEAFAGGSGPHHDEHKKDDAVKAFDQFNKVVKGAAKEVKGIAKKTGSPEMEGTADVVGGVAGLALDLFDEQIDDEDDEPKQLLQGSGGEQGSGDVLVFSDDAAGYITMRVEDGSDTVLGLRLHDSGDLTGSRNELSELAPGFRTRPEHSEVRDYDFRRPLLELKARVGEELEEHQPGRPLEMYDHHGEYITEDVGDEAATLHLEQHRRDAATAHGRGRCARVTAGHMFLLDTQIHHAGASLGEHTRLPNGLYAITRVTHEYYNAAFGGRADDDLEGLVRGCAHAIHEAVNGRAHPEEELRKMIRSLISAPTGSPRSYQNTFECVAGQVAFRPPRPPRKRRIVTETATVMGPEGQDIYHDKYGRVKVQFHWDREGEFSEHSSCWLRVAQPWAGAGYGFQFFPRIGMEVLVTFVGGDTDRPVVVGSLYNGTHATPEPLPERMTRSGIRTQTSPNGGGFNELSFEDAKEKERIYIHAQRNLEQMVNFDHDMTVGHRQRLSVEGDQESGIAGDQRTNIGHDRSTAVGGNETAFVRGTRRSRVVTDQEQRIGGNNTVSVGGTRTTQVTMSNVEVVRGVHSVSAQSGVNLQVGGAEYDVAATAYVQGAAYVTAKERVLVRTESEEDPASIRFECGESVIEMRHDCIVIDSPTIHIRGDNKVQIHGGKVRTTSPDSIGMEANKVGMFALDNKAHIAVVEDHAALWSADTASVASQGQLRIASAQVSIDGDPVDFGQEPPPEPGSIPRARGAEEREEEPANVKLRFTHHATDDSDPIADTPYHVVAGEFTYSGSTDPDGKMEFYCPENLIPEVTLMADRTYSDLYQDPLRFSLATPDEVPEIESVFGAAFRLRNLGYHPGNEDKLAEEIDDSTAEALRQFQFDHKIAETGEWDEDTQEKLEEVYGS